MHRVMVVKEFQFEAAHFLPQHTGMCRHLHGHSYRLQIGIVGEPKNDPVMADTGMVMDFNQLKKIVTEQVIRHLDHQCLNECTHLPGFPASRPTAELTAIWIADQLSNLPLSLVRLWETQTAYAEVVLNKQGSRP